MASQEPSRVKVLQLLLFRPAFMDMTVASTTTSTLATRAKIMVANSWCHRRPPRIKRWRRMPYWLRSHGRFLLCVDWLGTGLRK